MHQRYTTLFTADQVNTEIARMASEIIQTYRTKQPLFVALLRGAAPFASKLMFEIARQAPDMHPEIDYMLVSTYGSGTLAQDPEIVTDLAPTTVVDDRPVIVLDDVLDKGITAEFVREHLFDRGATTVALAVLAQKQTNRDYDITPDYCGFVTHDEWLVGMGMDDADLCHEGNRWNEEILEIKRP